MPGRICSELDVGKYYRESKLKELGYSLVGSVSLKKRVFLAEIASEAKRYEKDNKIYLASKEGDLFRILSYHNLETGEDVTFIGERK